MTAATVRVHLTATLGRLRLLLPTQPIGEAATNEEEARALGIVIEQVRRSWQQHAGTPSEADIRSLLSLVHVFPLDVGPGKPAEIQALDTLRQRVLRDPLQANAAWNAIVAACAEYTRRRSGADRADLVEVLLQVPCDVQVARSFRADIERLRSYTRDALRDLAEASRIRVGAIEVKISRLSTAALRSAAENQSVVVVGDAGGGKSGALHDLVAALCDEGRDVVLLAAGRIEATSSGSLRTELALDHDLLEVLRSWPGSTPGVFVVDALDAARGEPAAAMLRELISRIVADQGRWRIVASIRKFDLRNSHPLRRLFSGPPPTGFSDTEFVNVGHINIPLLDQDELNQIANQSPALYSLVRATGEDLRHLLRTPFNLRLAADLLAQGVAAEQLTPIRTQHELLETYWRHRVISTDAYGDAREAVIRRVCEAMVARRKMIIARAAVTDTSSALHLHALLSCQLLAEWQPSATAAPDRYSLTFSHHVLFDYSVARTLLRGPVEDLVSRLTSDPDLVLSIRPSLAHYFRDLWEADPARAVFWESVLKILAAPGVSEVAKIIGPAIAAESARDLTDLEALNQALTAPALDRRAAAELGFRELIQAVLEDPHTSQANRRADLWCKFVELVTR